MPIANETPADSVEFSGRSMLGLWDVVSLIVGIVVGASIFKVPGIIFQLSGDPLTGLMMWGLGALLALSGALCYAELASTYPQFGAEYVYLGRAYGKRMGFLFGWIQTFVILPGSVGAMAFVFADYASALFSDSFPESTWSPHPGVMAACAIGGLMALQMAGFVIGKVAQNVLTAVKVISLTGVLICGLLLSTTSPSPVPQTPVAESAVEATSSSRTWDGLGLALVFVLYAFGGWSDAAAVAPEVRDCRKNVPRALVLGLTLITALYLLLNLSFLRGLGYADACSVDAPAAEVIHRALGPTFSGLMSLIIMASALGAIHGMMFSGCRLLTAIGEDFRLFRSWSHWNSRQVPFWSLLTVGGISLTLTAVVGTATGRSEVGRMLQRISIPEPDWERYGGGFEVLVSASAPIFWFFFLLSGLSLLVLRIRDRDRTRPFQVPGYPLTPLIFITSAGFMLWSSFNYAGKLTLIMLPILLAGIVLAILQKVDSLSARENSRPAAGGKPD